MAQGDILGGGGANHPNATRTPTAESAGTDVGEVSELIDDTSYPLPGRIAHPGFSIDDTADGIRADVGPKGHVVNSGAFLVHAVTFYVTIAFPPIKRHPNIIDNVKSTKHRLSIILPCDSAIDTFLFAFIYAIFHHS